MQMYNWFCFLLNMSQGAFPHSIRTLKQKLNFWGTLFNYKGERSISNKKINISAWRWNESFGKFKALKKSQKTPFSSVE